MICAAAHPLHSAFVQCVHKYFWLLWFLSPCALCCCQVIFHRVFTVFLSDPFSSGSVPFLSEPFYSVFLRCMYEPQCRDFLRCMCVPRCSDFLRRRCEPQCSDFLRCVCVYRSVAMFSGVVPVLAGCRQQWGQCSGPALYSGHALVSGDVRRSGEAPGGRAGPPSASARRPPLAGTDPDQSPADTRLCTAVSKEADPLWPSGQHRLGIAGNRGRRWQR